MSNLKTLVIPPPVTIGYLTIFNQPQMNIRWVVKIVQENDGKFYIQDTSEYSLFSNSMSLGIGDTMGEAINDFMSKEKGYIDAL